ncbi:MAG: hypothetical protein AB1547_00085 [Thermodesulfobacteriota bacterium]
MSVNPEPIHTIQEMAESLVNLSLSREVAAFAVRDVPMKAEHTVLEYESRILQILGVGWAISYFMADRPEKQPLTEAYWNKMFDFSRNLSAVVSAALPEHFDYMHVLKQRMDAYLSEFSDLNSDTRSASSLQNDILTRVGLTFARLCGDPDDVHLILAGNRLFHLSLEGVKHYLTSVLV